jgi:hypothetical protein
MGILVDPQVLALSVVETIMRPPPPPDYNAWAERNIVFGRESPIPGPYRRETFPPAARILEVLGTAAARCRSPARTRRPRCR